MGIPLRSGRLFDERDRAGAPLVALIDETSEQRYWQGRDPLAGRVRFPWPGWLSVVGVVGSVRNNDLAGDAVERRNARDRGPHGLGARAGDVLRMVLRDGTRLAAAGIAAGLALALVLTRLLRDLLVEVSLTDPLTFAAVPALLAEVALFARYLPARRATRVDPMTAMRRE